MTDELSNYFELKEELAELIGEVVVTLEEDRVHPSVRQAGTTPSEKAVELSGELMVAFIKHYKDTDFSVLDNDYWTPEKIKEVLESNPHRPYRVSELQCLKEVDFFSDDGGFAKYKFYYTVYHHLPTDTYLQVCEQRDACGEETLSVDVTLDVKKKEKVTYEWG